MNEPSRILDDLTKASNGEPISQGESRAEAFRRLATKRVNVVLDDLRILGNLSSPSYTYDEQQVDKIFKAIQDKVDEVYGSFIAKSKPKGFEL